MGHVTSYWQNVQGKVLTVAWHPTKENLLAFGTAEARVGRLMTLNGLKQFFIHSTIIYTNNINKITVARYFMNTLFDIKFIVKLVDAQIIYIYIYIR